MSRRLPRKDWTSRPVGSAPRHGIPNSINVAGLPRLRLAAPSGAAKLSSAVNSSARNRKTLVDAILADVAQLDEIRRLGT